MLCPEENECTKAPAIAAPFGSLAIDAGRGHPCNCSLCRRTGGPWVYFEFGTVRITGHPENTAEYVRATGRCGRFVARPAGASPTGSRSTEPQAAGMACTSETSIRSSSRRCASRRFDGADTWKFFDE